MKQRALAAGLTLLALVSGLCLAGLREIDRRLAKEEDHDKVG